MTTCVCLQVGRMCVLRVAYNLFMFCRVQNRRHSVNDPSYAVCAVAQVCLCRPFRPSRELVSLSALCCVFVCEMINPNRSVEYVSDQLLHC